MNARVPVCAFGAACVASVVAARPAAAAEAKPFDDCGKRSVCSVRSGEYVAAHAAGAGALALAAIITDNAFDPKVPRVTPVLPTMSAAADSLLVLELGLPLSVYAATMRTPELGDALLSYAQTGGAALVVNHLLRPARLNSSALAAFSMAVTSSYLLDQRHMGMMADGPDKPRASVDIRVRGTFWGLQLSLASANGILAARSGRSSFFGVILGAGLGVGLGYLNQVVHRGATIPSFMEAEGDDAFFVWGANVSLLALGVVLPWFPRAPADDSLLRYTITVEPLGPGAAGPSLHGTF
jgi:hypothetical protein